MRTSVEQPVFVNDDGVYLYEPAGKEDTFYPIDEIRAWSGDDLYYEQTRQFGQAVVYALLRQLNGAQCGLCSGLHTTDDCHQKPH